MRFGLRAQLGHGAGWASGIPAVPPPAAPAGPTVLPLALTITNSDFASLTGWTADSGTWSVLNNPTGPGTAHGGSGNCARQTSTSGELYQDLDLSAAAADIDNGLAQLELSWWHATNGPNDDCGGASIEFLDAGAASLAPGKMVQPADETISTTWTERTETFPVPPGARTARLTFWSRRTSGGGTTTYYDTVSASLTHNGGPFSAADGAQALRIFNPDFEHRGISNFNEPNWTDSAGSTVRVTADPVPAFGTYALRGTGGNNLPYTTAQQLSVLGHGFAEADVDAGNVSLNLSCQFATNDAAGDQGRLTVRFLEADGATELGTETTGWLSGNTWSAQTIGPVALPAGTRILEIQLEGDNSGGGTTATAAWDEFAGTLEVT